MYLSGLRRDTFNFQKLVSEIFAGNHGTGFIKVDAYFLVGMDEHLGFLKTQKVLGNYGIDRFTGRAGTHIG